MANDDRLTEALRSAQTQHGDSLYDLSNRARVLLIFLRHLG
jgi:hypothetical protein